MIRLEGVTRRYRSAAGDRTALDAVDLHVARGEVFGVVGRSGAGKSTLIRAINRLETPDAGKVFVEYLSPFKLGRIKTKLLKQQRVERQEAV